VSQQLRQLDLNYRSLGSESQIVATDAGYAALTSGSFLPWGPTGLPWCVGLRSFLDTNWEAVGPMGAVLVLAHEVSAAGPVLSLSVDASAVESRAPSWWDYCRQGRLTLEIAVDSASGSAALLVNGRHRLSAQPASILAWNHLAVHLSDLQTAVNALLPEYGLDVAETVQWYLSIADVGWSDIQIAWDKSAVSVFSDTFVFTREKLVLRDRERVEDYADRQQGLASLSQHHTEAPARGVYLRHNQHTAVSLLAWPHLVWAGSADTLDVTVAARQCWRLGDRLMPRVSLLGLLGLTYCTLLTARQVGATLCLDGRLTAAAVWPLLALWPLERLRDSYALGMLQDSAVCLVSVRWDTAKGRVNIAVRRHTPVPQRMIWRQEARLAVYVS